MSVNAVDAIALLIVGVAIFFGWRSGFVIQGGALIGFIVGIGLVVLLGSHIGGALSDVDPWLRTFLVIGVVAGIVLLAQAIGSAIGGHVRRRLGRGVLGTADQGAGAFFGLARGIFLVWLMGGLIGLLPTPVLAAEARSSTILQTLDSRLPSPVVLAAELGRLIEAAGLPDVFVGAPPPAAAPDTGVSAAEAAAIAADAQASTARVESVACGNFVSGTGFAVSPTHFVTNAHVVAGTQDVWLSFEGSLARVKGQVVMFNPDLDAALVAVDAPLPVEPLRLATDLPERGEMAAAVGFTGGGRQRVIPAVVNRTVEALGRDIYGVGIVTRRVVELRADVAPGDSGGPVLLEDGTVGGVTFSESRANAEIGYALSPLEVAEALNGSLRSFDQVAVGECLPPR